MNKIGIINKYMYKTGILEKDGIVCRTIINLNMFTKLKQTKNFSSNKNKQ